MTNRNWNAGLLSAALLLLTLLSAACGRTTSASDTTPAETPGGVEQWWDTFAFDDTTSANSDRAEQLMADWIYATGQADSVVRVHAAEAFVRQASASGHWLRYWALTDHYLGNPNSPVRDDRLYAALLREAIRQVPMSEGDSVKWADRLRCIDRNQVGAIATDFPFVRRDGKRDGAGTLADFVNAHVQKGQYLLLMFYDPDCDNCKLTLGHLREDTQLAEWIGHGQVKLLAVYYDADTDLWNRHPEACLPTWYDAYSPDGQVHAQMRYYLPASPSFYLLDHERRILLKDATWDVVSRRLGREFMVNG